MKEEETQLILPADQGKVYLRLKINLLKSLNDSLYKVSSSIGLYSKEKGR